MVLCTFQIAVSLKFLLSSTGISPSARRFNITHPLLLSKGAQVKVFDYIRCTPDPCPLPRHGCMLSHPEANLPYLAGRVKY